MRKRYLTPFASTAAFEAARAAPSAIVWPTYGVFEKGALTAIVTVFVLSALLSSPPQPVRTAQSPSTTRSRLTRASVVLDRPSSLLRRRRPAQVCLTRSDGLPREPSPHRRRAGRS